MLIVPAAVFLLNVKGFPVLPKHHQNLIHRYMRLRPLPYILLTDTTATAITNSSNSPESSSKNRRLDSSSYSSYMRYLQKLQPPLAPVEIFGAGYQDWLQAPLQPLTDNLESTTYEVFERDPVKYDQYEKAIRLALKERDSDSTMYNLST